MARVVNKTKGFSSISRDCVFDSEISDRARFIYVYMACKPEGWEFFQDKMAEELGIKKDTLRKYLDELIIRGWLTELEQENDGRFGSLEYIIEINRKDNNLPIRKKTDTEKNRIGKNHNHINIDNISSDYKLSSDYKEIEKEKGYINISQKENTRFVKPTLEEIDAYIKEKGFHFDAEHFLSHYQSVGWKRGNNKIKDWKAACRYWEHGNKKKEYEPLSTDEDKVKRFKLWMREKHSGIEFCEKPLTFDGYMRLQREYGMDNVCNQLDYIDANIGKFKKCDIELVIKQYLDKQ